MRYTKHELGQQEELQTLYHIETETAEETFSTSNFLAP